MSDAGQIEAVTPSNRGDEVVTSACAMTIEKGEDAPQMGDCGPVTGIAHDDCSWSMNYQVIKKFKQVVIE